MSAFGSHAKTTPDVNVGICYKQGENVAPHDQTPGQPVLKYGYIKKGKIMLAFVIDFFLTGTVWVSVRLVEMWNVWLVYRYTQYICRFRIDSCCKVNTGQLQRWRKFSERCNLSWILQSCATPVRHFVENMIMEPRSPWCNEIKLNSIWFCASCVAMITDEKLFLHPTSLNKPAVVKCLTGSIMCWTTTLTCCDFI